MPLGCAMKDALGWTYIILGVLLGGIAIYGDVDSLGAIRAQAQSVRWTKEFGTIVSSAVEVVHGDRGQEREEAVLRYEYVAGGKKRESTNYRAGTQALLPSIDGSVEFAHLAKPGDGVTVWYDPENPDDAAIEVGLGRVDALAVVFLFLLNLGAIGAWCGYWMRRRSFARFADSAGVPVLEDDERLCLRLPRQRPATFALVAMLVASGASFVVLVVFDGIDIAVSDAAGLLGGFVVLGAVLWWRQRAQLLTGCRDLVVDGPRGRLRLPQTFGRVDSREIELASIRDVEVVRANKSRSSPIYAVEIVSASDEDSPTRLRLVKWNEPLRGEVFAKFLKERIERARGK